MYRDRAQVTMEVCDAFLSALSLPSDVMQPAFGMAEVCTCMTYNNNYGLVPSVRVLKASTQEEVLRLATPDAAPQDTITFVDLGPVSPGVEMRIARDGGTHVLRELQVGHEANCPYPFAHP